jgi:hypothetical protein
MARGGNAAKEDTAALAPGDGTKPVDGGGAGVNGAVVGAASELANSPAQQHVELACVVLGIRY